MSAGAGTIAATSLPARFAPMLATAGPPFDSDRHLFEVKWDGIRAVTMVDRGRVRMLSRRGIDLTGNYPELAVLERLPPGTMVDGEIVVLNEGRPDFEFVLRRDRRGPGAADGDARPAAYLAFDLTYLGYEPTMELPLTERRARLAELVEACGTGHVAFSEGIVGAGMRFYREVCERAMEGVMAKRLDSRYLPGRRSDAWVKIKRRISYHCLVLGFIDKEGRDFQSLAVATERAPGAGLHYAGRVGTGFDAAERGELNDLLRRHRCAEPLLPMPADRSARDQLDQVSWVEPVLFCVVSCVEMTAGGMLRAPVFERLVREGED
ncbi:MAG: hypothetical protein OXC12_02190 [Spirochaetaceae bacterium]|nr:hypothetical protein [Spirochaetaceae bacterium]